MLQHLFDECVEEPRARAVVVTAPAGIGKSRLASEFVRLLHHRGDAVAVWAGQGDVLRAGSAYSLLRATLRGVFGLHDGEPPEARRNKIRARVGRHVPEDQRQRVAEFLGALLAVPFGDERSAQLRAAEGDAQLMSEQVSRAWEDLLQAECAEHPVVIVLDDLHWGDLPSVRVIDGALRRLGHQRWMVLALGRPEIDASFPRLWEGRRVQRIHLEELGRKASERLVRMVLGERVGSGTVEWLVGQSGGHAFYLEELIRAVAEGKGDALPETVVAMVEARLGALDPDARRILRAASIFGEVFWPSAVASLLGGAPPLDEMQRALSRLIEHELLTDRPDSRFPGEQELAFRHALLREGAYAMLTEDDRILGHRLAGRWLEQRGESDPMVLAEHFERGRESARAGDHYARAAEQALFGGDPEATIVRARRGLACDVPRATRVALQSMLLQAHGWRKELTAASICAEEVLRLGTPGSAPWLLAAMQRLGWAPQLSGDLMDLFHAVENLAPPPEAPGQVAFPLTQIWAVFALRGRADLAEAIYRRMHAWVTPIVDHDPIARGWLLVCEMSRGMCGIIDLWSALLAGRAALAIFRELEHPRVAALTQYVLGNCLWLVGAFSEATSVLEEIRGMTLGASTWMRDLCLTFVLIEGGALERALEVALDMIALGRKQELGIDEASGRHALAAVLFRRGELEAAEREVAAAIEPLAFVPMQQMAARALFAAILLAQGRTAEARVVADAAMSQYDAFRAFGFRGAFARLVHAEALHATGEHERARATLAATRAHLLASAAKIDDPAARRVFLESVLENARVLALARAWRCDERPPAGSIGCSGDKGICYVCST